jgi:hypothetical protein
MMDSFIAKSVSVVFMAGGQPYAMATCNGAAAGRS